MKMLTVIAILGLLSSFAQADEYSDIESTLEYYQTTDTNFVSNTYFAFSCASREDSRNSRYLANVLNQPQSKIRLQRIAESIKIEDAGHLSESERTKEYTRQFRIQLRDFFRLAFAKAIPKNTVQVTNCFLSKETGQ